MTSKTESSGPRAALAAAIVAEREAKADLDDAEGALERTFAKCCELGAAVARLKEQEASPSSSL